MRGRLVHMPAGGLNESTDWSTDQEVFDYLNSRFGPFTIDVCAEAHNAKCEDYFTQDQDGLSREWKGTAWMNPPYGREITLWIRKAWQTGEAGHVVVCLVPSRTSTRWWHDYVMAGTVFFVRGQLAFGDHKQKAPFPSAVVIFGPFSDREK